MAENRIKVLDDITHVLTVPGRYVGSINHNTRDEYFVDLDGTKYSSYPFKYVPAIITLFKEVVSNSIDEFVRTNGKFGNKIDIDITDDKITIRDNGRGLQHITEPVTNMPESVVAFTQLKAGENFNDDTASIGQNGEGVSLVNIFSKEFNVKTSDGKKKTTIKCSDNMKNIDYKLTNCKSQFTEVSFILDFERFKLEGIDNSHFSIMKRIVFDYKMCYPKIKFSFNGDKVKFNGFKEYCSFYHKDVETFEYKNLEVGIFPTDEFKHISFVNGINTRRGGIHIDQITHYIIKGIRDKLVKKYKSLKPAHIRNNFGFIINLRNMKAPRFDSQTKEELINDSFDNELLSDIDWLTISKKILKNKILIDPIIEYFKVKEEFKKRQELKGKEKKGKVINLIKLMDANSKKRDQCSLYIGEGKSAVGSMFMTCRDSKFQAGYPLRGKFISCQDTDLNKLIKNAEVSDLCTALNVRLSSDSIKDIRYGKIIIMTDQDPDGFGIKAHLVNYFYTFWPDLVKKGMLYIAESPLIKAKDPKGRKKNFFSMDDFKKVNVNNDWTILHYNKGLGSLSESDYTFTMNNMIQITEDDLARDNLDIAFGKNYADERKKWMML